MYKIILPGNPIPSARARILKSGHSYNPKAKQQSEIAWDMKSQFLHVPLSEPISLQVTFFMPKPLGWSGKKKKAYEGQPHCKRPDLSNMIKFYEDAANGILWFDDALVYNIIASKFYSEKPRTEIIIEIKDL